MSKVAIHGDLWVDHEMFDQVMGLFARKDMPDLDLTWGEFIDPHEWNQLPNLAGKLYRAELVRGRTADHGTIKVNRWLGPDERDPDGEKPHNHPWDEFTSYILRGGYKEKRSWLKAGKVVSETFTYRQGDRNVIKQDIYHEVTEVFGEDTLTVMVCGNGKKGDWGYLDLATGTFSKYEPDPKQQRLKKLLNAGKP